MPDAPPRRLVPFSIDTQPAARGMAVFTAIVNDRRITSERYAPGDGDKRRKIARLWADNHRLCNGQPLSASEIATALEQAENTATEAAAAMSDDAEDSSLDDTAQQRAAYCDDTTCCNYRI